MTFETLKFKSKDRIFKEEESNYEGSMIQEKSAKGILNTSMGRRIMLLPSSPDVHSVMPRKHLVRNRIPRALQ